MIFLGTNFHFAQNILFVHLMFGRFTYRNEDLWSPCDLACASLYSLAAPRNKTRNNLTRSV